MTKPAHWIAFALLAGVTVLHMLDDTLPTSPLDVARDMTSNDVDCFPEKNTIEIRKGTYYGLDVVKVAYWCGMWHAAPVSPDKLPDQ